MIADMDCLICLENHSTIDCPDRKPQHCPSCHIYIKQLTDHSSVCGMKLWSYQPYKDLYAAPPLERMIVSCNSPFRFLYNGDWRQPFDGQEMYSPESGIIIRFKNVNDFSCLTCAFAPVRIAVVVKEGSRFVVKLMLLASRERFIVALPLNEPFDRHAKKEWSPTLVLCTPYINDLCLSVMITPPRRLAELHELKYDSSTKGFIIPDQIEMTEAQPNQVDEGEYRLQNMSERMLESRKVKMNNQ